MSASLPLLASVVADAVHCSYCPKLCRFACPVAEATGREAVTPWGINRSIAAAVSAGAADAVPPADAIDGPPAGRTPADLENAWACTGCRRCGSACLPGLDLSVHVRAARAALLDGHPPALRLQAAAGGPVPAGGTLVEHADPSAPLLVHPGCASDGGAGLAAALTALGLTYRVPAAPVCCGARAADVGWQGEASARARAWAEATAGADEVVVADPHCARWLRIDQGDERVRDLPSLLHDHLSGAAMPRLAGPASADPKGPTKAGAAGAEGAGGVSWHDPCWLGRGLGTYDAGRAVVQALTGSPPLETEQHRDRAGCTGGGMAYPVSDPEGAQRVLAGLVAAHRATGATTTVTACPTAALRLRAGGLDAYDLPAWIATRLDPTPEHP